MDVRVRIHRNDTTYYLGRPDLVRDVMGAASFSNRVTACQAVIDYLKDHDHTGLGSIIIAARR